MPIGVVQDGDTALGTSLVDHITDANKSLARLPTTACPLFNRLDLDNTSVVHASSYNTTLRCYYLPFCCLFYSFN